MASNKIHLGNTKIVSAAGAPEGIVIASPTKSGTMALLSDVGGGASPVDTYTKTEIDDQQDAQDADIVINNDEIARQQIEITNNTANITKNDTAINKNILDIATNTGNIASNTAQIATNTADIAAMGDGGGVPTDTYTKAQIDEQQGIQDSNISSNTTAIGTLSGQVGQNSEDIAELQDSIFFSSAYSADYPSSPNRDPENGNMYLQNFAMFTYSYASATQIFASKTDESGNVRQFTAIQPGDSIVLNEVDSPNYGRYELVSIEEVSESYVVMNVIPKLGEGTIVAGVKVAFQGFPKPDSGDSYTKAESDAIDDAQDVIIATKIDEAPIDGKEYARKDAEWVEVSGGDAIAFRGELSANQTGLTTATWAKLNLNTTSIDTDNALVDGKFKPSVAGYYQVNGGVREFCSPVSTLTVASIYKNGLLVTVGSYGVMDESTNCSVNDIIYLNGTTDYLELFGQVKSSGTCGIASPSKDTYLSAVLVTGGSGTGGIPEAPVDGKQYGRQDAEWTEVTGGGGSTSIPEALVWEDKKPERGFDTVFTNTNDVPLYVQLFVNARQYSYVQFMIDGEVQGYNGNGSVGEDRTDLSNPLYIIPAGSTYAANKFGTLDDWFWKEARMPVAIGVPSVDTVIGMVAPFAMDSVPTGWLHCDGSAVSRTTYSLLYSKVADLYGAGDGSTTFNLPNLQDEFVRGSSDTLAVGTKQDDEFKSHLHEFGVSKDPVYGDGGSVGAEGGSMIGRSIGGDVANGDPNYGMDMTGGTETRPRNVAMLYCINATAEPSSSGGEVQEAVVMKAKLSANQSVPKEVDTKVNLVDTIYDTDSAFADGKFQPNVAGYYQVNGIVGSKSSTPKSLRTIALIYLNGVYETAGTDLAYAEDAGWDGISNVSSIIYLNGTSDYIELYGYVSSTGAVINANTTELSASLITGQSSGGSGGSSYTPEPLVWEDKLAERAWATDYVNPYDVPLYLQIGASSTATEACTWYVLIDGVSMGTSGKHSGAPSVYNTSLFIVPAGSTYSVNKTRTNTFTAFNEARMPVAVGTGGKTVAFRGEMSANQTVTTITWTKVNLNTVSIDTDSALTDGKFQPSVAGYYQVNASVAQDCSPSSKQTIVSIYKNGERVTNGPNIQSDTGSKSSVASDIIYFNGTTDYLELYGFVNSTGTCAIISSDSSTFLSAVLVSGGSGDSLWTEEDGKAVYDGEVELNTTGTTQPTITLKNDSGYAGVIDAQHDAVIKAGGFEALRVLSANRKIETVADMTVNGQLKSKDTMTITSTATGARNLINAGSEAGNFTIQVDEEEKLSTSAFNVYRGSQEAMRIASDQTTMTSADGKLAFRIASNGSVRLPEVVKFEATGNANVYIDANGRIHKALTTAYSTQEVDEKLAIKDKLIEKLSARLDELEKRLKK